MFEQEIEDAGGDDEIGPVESSGVNELLRNTELAMAQQSRMEWQRYAAAAMLHRRLVEPTAGTELIDGSQHVADSDREIAEYLSRQGSWSKSRMRDMVDAAIFRRDPDLVRNSREDAKKNRGVWGSNAEHGMAVLDAHGPAEEMTMIMTRLEKLAMSTCKADPRRRSDRMADALFATVMGREFYCQCPNDPNIPAPLRSSRSQQIRSSRVSM